VVFVGSYAPVLFFLASGFGLGLSHARKGPPAWPATLWKVALLVLADQVSYWSRGEPFGIDFFSFIGFGMLMLAAVARAGRPVAVCVGLAGAIVAVRWGAGPILVSWLPPFAPLDWWLGVRPVVDVSYPFSPWAIFSLAGFALGCRYVAGRPARTPRLADAWLWVGLGAAALAFVLAGVMMANGSVPFRWSTMNATYFLLAIGVVCTAGLAARSASIAVPKVASRLALGGVASFAFIPVHYALLAISRHALAPMSVGGYFLACMVLIPLSWWLAERVAAAAMSEAAARHEHAVFATLLVAALCLSALILADPWPRGLVSPIAWTVVTQLAIAALLGLRTITAKRAEPVDRHVARA